jgi:hypothetical protein
MLTLYPKAALFRVLVMKYRETIALQRQNGICRGFRKKVEDLKVKCHGNPSNATNRNWKNVTNTPDR